MLQNIPLIAAAVLALVHGYGVKPSQGHGRARSRWLSFGGGIAVAYVFTHLLPELGELQRRVEEDHVGGGWYWPHHLYITGLVGLCVFYAVEHGAKTHAREQQNGRAGFRLMFAAHMALLSGYNTFVGYFLVQSASGSYTSLGIFTCVFALHFLGNDQFLREDYKHLYIRYGRWVLCIALLADSVAARLWHVPELPYGMVLAFLVGGVTLNAIKEELPNQKESRMWPFLLGTVICAAALILAQQ